MPFTSELGNGADLGSVEVVRTGEAHWIESYLIDRHIVVTISDLDTGTADPPVGVTTNR